MNERFDYELPEDEMNALRQEVMEFAEIGLCRYNLEGRVVFIDPVALRLLELDDIYPDTAEVVGKDLNDLFDHTHTPGEVRRQIIQHGRVRNAEYSLRTLKGNTRWMLHDSFLVQDSRTGEQTIQVIFRDITAQKKSEEVLREREARQRELIDRLNEGFAIVEPDGTFSYVNARLAEILGYTREELLGKSPPDILDDAAHEKALVELEERKAGRGGRYELELISYDGHRVQTLVAAVPRFDDAGEFLGSFAVFAEVGELKRAQERYRLLFETMLHAFVLLEIVRDDVGEPSDFRLIEVNPALEEMSNSPAQALVGRTLSSLLSKDEGFPYDLLARVARSGESERFERFVPVAKMYLEGIVYRPQPEHIAAILTDITSRKNLESQLRQADKLQAIGTLASGVAHEINTPLNVIMNYAELIQRDPGNRERVESFTSEIDAEAQRVAGIVRDLLLFSRQAREDSAPHDVAEIVQSAVSLVGKVLRGDMIRLKVDLPPYLPPISCKHQQIQQVLVNLITNARDALNEVYEYDHEEKVIEVTCREVEIDGGQWVQVTVKDRGIGVPPDVIDQIFDPFFTTKPVGAGTGLGLSVSQGIIEEHQGRLWLESTTGGPTKFHMELRAATPFLSRDP